MFGEKISLSRSWVVVGVVLALVAPLPAWAPGSGGPTPAGASAGAVSGGDYAATIRTTSYGIPHVLADNLGSAGFGVAYAFAKQNICTLANEFVTVRAERSRFFGPDGRAVNQATGANDSNLDSDFFYASVNDSHIIEDTLAEAPPLGPTDDAKELVQGYAAGYNAYLHDVGVDGIEDSRCQGADWVQPITALDVWRRVHQLDIQAGGGLFVTDQVAATPPDPAGASPSATRSSNRVGSGDLDALKERLHLESGSNGLGIGRDDTAAGNGGVLLGNPHFPWQGSERFWAFQMTVPGVVNVTGASLMGLPIVNIGFNQHVAWTHTVSTARRFVLFRLNLDPSDPTRYAYGSGFEAMEPQTVTVQARGTDGSLTDRSHTFWMTRYGRVTNLSDAGLAWNTTNAYAFHDANADNLRTVDTWLAMNEADSAQGLIDAQSHFQGVPWVNTIGVDDGGTAFYTDDTVVPNVSDAQASRCVPAGLPQILMSVARLFVLDGSDTTCGLGTDPDAVEPGLFGPSNLPVLTRSDYVQNSNDSAWMTNPAVPMTDFPLIVGRKNVPLGMRTRLGLDMVNQRMAGTDGQAGTGFDVANLQALWDSDRSLGAELVHDDLVQLCRDNPTVHLDGGQTVDVSEACPILESFGNTGDYGDPGGWLFDRWWSYAQAGSMWADAFDPANPTTTPRHLDVTAPSNITALGEAVAELRAHGVPLDAANPDVHYALDGTQRIPIHGCIGGAGCYNAIYGEIVDGPDYGRVDAGSSWVMTVRMDPDTGPHGESILTYSQSDNPDSPHFADQTRAFSDKEWVPMLFTEDEIASDPNLVVTTVRSDATPPSTTTTSTTTSAPPPTAAPTTAGPTSVPATVTTTGPAGDGTGPGGPATPHRSAPPAPPVAAVPRYTG